jgi:hypothetical protein
LLQSVIKSLYIHNKTLSDILKEIYEGLSYPMKGVAAATDFPMGLTDAVLATVDNVFLIGETEVTYELWYAVRVWAEANGYIFQNDGKEGNNGTASEAPTVAENEPVTTVSWRDSVVWLNALSEMDGGVLGQ